MLRHYRNYPIAGNEPPQNQRLLILYNHTNLALVGAKITLYQFKTLSLKIIARHCLCIGVGETGWGNLLPGVALTCLQLSIAVAIATDSYG